MKFLIKLYGSRWFEKAHIISGYEGDIPYLDCGAPYEDNIGRQHLKLSVPSSQDCYKETKNSTVCFTHVPSDYKMITKKEYKEYLTLKEKFGKYIK